MMPPAPWLRAALSPRLTGDAAETFIDVLDDERSYQRLAFALGARWARESHLHALRAARSDADERSTTPHALAPSEPPPAA